MRGITKIKVGTDTKRNGKNCLIVLTRKSAKLQCSEFSTQENRELKMQRKNSVFLQ